MLKTIRLYNMPAFEKMELNNKVVKFDVNGIKKHANKPEKLSK